MDKVDAEIVALRLQKLFDPGSFFSISDFQELLEMCGGIPPRGVYARLRALHCVYYREMSPQMREWLFGAVVDALGTPAFPVQPPVRISVQIESPNEEAPREEPRSESPKRGILGFLFGGSEQGNGGRT